MSIRLFCLKVTGSFQDTQSFDKVFPSSPKLGAAATNTLLDVMQQWTPRLDKYIDIAGGGCAKQCIEKNKAAKGQNSQMHTLSLKARYTNSIKQL